MVRQCAIPGCKNNDQVILCHRFPKRKEFMEKWRNSLALDGIDPAKLFNRYVVCTQHFQATDYRNSASRMLNLMAVPTLNVFWKGEIYDRSTSCQDEVKQLKMDDQAQINPVNKYSEPASEATEIEVLEIEQAEPEIGMTVETVRPVDKECEVFYIEEEAKHAEVQTVPEYQLEVLEECSIETPLQLPAAKRKCILGDPQSNSSSPQKISHHDVAVQTEDPVEISEERQLVAERYPEYAKFSRLDFAKELKETSDQLAEVKKKLAHIEAAHAVVREAFKSIMS